MWVIKRNGRKQEVRFDKITSRVQRLCYGLDATYVDATLVSKRVIEGLYDGVTTCELDNLAAEIAATLTTRHPDYATLAARIAISNLQKNTSKSFSKLYMLFTIIMVHHWSLKSCTRCLKSMQRSRWSHYI